MLRAVPFPLVALELLPTKIQLPLNDASGQIYVSAMAVLNHFFGIEWLERWVMGKRGEKGNFLKNDWTTAERAESHKLRVVCLAEMLINLQDVPAFWSVLRSMVGKGVEAGFAELEAGALLKRRGIRFAFRAPSGVRGEDYDLDIDLDGLHICGETKCKVEATEPSVQSFLNSIKDARSRNLPSDKPGAIFVKIPQIWMDNAGFIEDFEIALRQYLETSGRLAIVLISTSPEVIGDAHIIALSAVKSVINPMSRFYERRIELLHEAVVIPGTWIDLVDLWGPHIPSHDHELHRTLRAKVAKDAIS